MMVDPISKAALKSLCTILASCPFSNALCAVYETPTLVHHRCPDLFDKQIGWMEAHHGVPQTVLDEPTQMLKHLRQYWPFGNLSVIGNGGGRWTSWDWGDIGLSPQSGKLHRRRSHPKPHRRGVRIHWVIIPNRSSPPYGTKSNKRRLTSCIWPEDKDLETDGKWSAD